jgi:hypothetical protein
MPGIANAKSDNPIVIELFTSQSCSSCPPADKTLHELSKQENIIALSCNVSYWNHLHWKDTLSKPFCNERQESYNRAFRNRTNYTPQMVFNGKHSAVGSNNIDISRAIRKASNKPITKLEISEIKSRSFQLANYNLSANHQLFAVIYLDDYTISIPSGENRGRKVTYTNPIQSILDVTSYANSVMNLEGIVTDNEHLVFILQDKVSREIIGVSDIFN